MKIEKGKLYYNHQLESVIISVEDSVDRSGILSDKIAVHCPTKEDWEYIKKQGYDLYQQYGGYSDEPYFILDGSGYLYLTHPNIKNYHIITIDQFKEFYPESVISNKTDDNVQNTQPHYDNTHGSLYQVAEQRKWNSYQFDIVKRIDRALKKGQFKEDLQKTKDLIDLWLREVKK